MINFPPRGLVADLVTPLDAGGRLDVKGLMSIMGRLSGEATAFLIGSVNVGEALHLDENTRLDSLGEAIEGYQNAAALFFDITTRTEEGTRTLLDQAEALLKSLAPRTEVFYVLTPLVYHSNRDLPQHMRKLGRLSRRPFILGNNPVLVGLLRSRLRHRNIRTAVLKKLAANDQIVGIGYEGDLSRALGYQRALKLRTGFRFYDGNEQNFLERPSSSGLISCGVVLMPRDWSDIVNSSLNIYSTPRICPDHLGRLWRSSQAVRSLLVLYHSNPARVLKTALKMMNVIDHSTAAADVPELEPGQKERLKRVLEELHLI